MRDLLLEARDPEFWFKYLILWAIGYVLKEVVPKGAALISASYRERRRIKLLERKMQILMLLDDPFFLLIELVRNAILLLACTVAFFAFAIFAVYAEVASIGSTTKGVVLFVLSNCVVATGWICVERMRVNLPAVRKYAIDRVREHSRRLNTTKASTVPPPKGARKAKTKKA